MSVPRAAGRRPGAAAGPASWPVARLATLVLPLLSGCGGDGPLTPDGPGGGCPELTLVPGAHVVREGAAAVGCVVLPAAGRAAEYEVVVGTVSRTLGFSAMELRLAPAGVPISPDAATASEAGASPSAAAAAPDRPAGDGDVAAGSPDAAWRAGQAAWDRRMRRLEADLRPAIRAAARGGPGLFAVPAEGDTLRFGFSCITPDEFPAAPDSIAGVVRVVGARSVIVEDTAATGAFADADYREIAATFDELIWATDVAWFGEPGDIDANGGRVVLLYGAAVNRLSRGYDESFIAGFTCPLDLGAAGGNRAEMFYLMVPDPTGAFTPAGGDGISRAEVRRITDNTVAHEFQHLINAQAGGGGASDVWLNEGLSHLAEEVVGHAVNGFEPGAELGPEELAGSQARRDVFNKYYINNWFNQTQLLLAPGDTAALLAATDPLDFNTFRMRGAAWSFLRYVLDRFADGPTAEAARTRALVRSAAGDSRDAVTQVFGTDFNRLATEWAAMLAVEDRAAPLPPELTLPSYRLRAIYESNIGLAVNPPAGGDPLRPVSASLGVARTVPADLFTGTALYVRLSGTAASPATELRLVAPGTGRPLAAGVEPRLVIVRTR
ncbi:MAG: hypothetical protein RRA92_02155 [Gemmatimonadota bacterium]|nr:hypothetical protein [Gemmatimonadota bacterium]